MIAGIDARVGIGAEATPVDVSPPPGGGIQADEIRRRLNQTDRNQTPMSPGDDAAHVAHKEIMSA